MYRQYLAGASAIAHIKPVRLAYMVAYIWARLMSPRKAERILVKNQMQSCATALSQDVDGCWRDYLWHASASTLHTYLYASMRGDWIGSVMEVRGLSNLRAAFERRDGVLVLTGHQHSLMLLAVVLGLLKFPIHAILMDPRLTVPDFLESFVECAIRDSSLHFNGGDYIFVDYGGAFVRPVYRALAAGKLVLSANDFPASLAPKRRQVIPFLGREISCPTGSVEIAIKTGAAIVPSFIRRERGRMVVEFHAELKGKTEEVMSAYGALLETTVRDDPGGWEGWKWPDVFNTPEKNLG